ncbi:50S ribosomal protein L17 [Collinsella sp. An307]|uniref:50S ribosomal protein L17 n=1 Tax=Collinsella sp. An307 TaxID=1965630 RepID=UPI000B37ED86|nr:50S ribosomal protein L17 [Collinsella sp. An307]OUO18574.1 50S ribosomal protein L17 [Collinsella sp. An307]
MRHNKKKGLKLGTDAAHTRAMKKSLAKALFENDRIKTTETRAKALRGYVEPIITWAKKGDLHSRRLAIAKLGDKNLVAELFDKAAQGMWADRNGGYTRIMKLGPRKGDNAPMVIIEIVSEPVVKKAPKAAPAKKAEAPKKVEKAEEEAPVEVEETVEAEATEEKAAE